MSRQKVSSPGLRQQYAGRVDENAEPSTELRNRAELADQLRRDIELGKYQVDQKLPSYRALASKLGAAPNTVGEAVRLLAAEGRVVIKPQSGAYVVAQTDRPLTAEDRLHNARQGLLSLREELRAAQHVLSDLESRLSDILASLPAE